MITAQCIVPEEQFNGCKVEPKKGVIRLYLKVDYVDLVYTPELEDKLFEVAGGTAFFTQV